MFKKLKDKLAEEVKSSPQRIQQFAQAAQAAVTSASSSISDITNNDLFSIADSENQQSRVNVAQPSQSKRSGFEDVSLVRPPSIQTSMDSMEYVSSHDIIDHQRQRRLSNSSFTSDVSFRLPNYESPSMFHLQSDMEVSASEAEDRGLSGGSLNLDRVTKEQLYAVYKRTQDRYKKYRSQYADLARHYKLLERENGKARSVLEETQDKALRRISELREQCNLEQSAKAHLEKALRVELEEKNLKIDTLNTKIKLLQNNEDTNANLNTEDSNNTNTVNDHSGTEGPLIDLSNDTNKNQASSEPVSNEISILTNKIEKIEQLNNKYKESLKSFKEKTSQMTIELQILSKEVESKNKEIEVLNATAIKLTEAREKIKDLSDHNEDLQNQINSYDFTKTKEMSVLETDLQKANEEIIALKGKIEIFNKREEEYAISLAENKLSIHKELENKEAVIKSLTDNLSSSSKEIQSMNIVINEYKNRLSLLEEERSSLKNDISEVESVKIKLKQFESTIQELNKKCHILEQTKSKLDEENKCLQLQIKQETAEKLAMIDRNDYLNKRNTQLTNENEKKSTQIIALESDLQALKLKENSVDEISHEKFSSEKNELLEEIKQWKNKYNGLETEIQDERDELVKLQSEIENLLSNHERIQIQNSDLHDNIKKLEKENNSLKYKVSAQNNKIEHKCLKIIQETKLLREIICTTSNEINSFKNIHNGTMDALKEELNALEINVSDMNNIETNYRSLQIDNQSLLKNLETNIEEYHIALTKMETLQNENDELKSSIKDINATKQAMEHNITKINAQYESSKENLNRLKEENSYLKNELEQSEKEYQNLKNTINLENNLQLNQINSHNEEIQTIRNRCEITCNELNVKLQESEKLCESLKNKLNNNEKENSEQISNLKEQINNSNKQHETIISEFNLLKNENMLLTSKLHESEQNCQKIRDQINEIKDECSSHVENLSVARTTIENVSHQRELSLEQLDTLNNEYENIKSKLEQSENECEQLRDKLNCEQSLLNKVTDLEQQSQNKTEQYNVIDQEFTNLKIQFDDIKLKLDQSDKKCNDLQDEITRNHDQHTLLINKTEHEKQSLEENLHQIQKLNVTLNEEHSKLKTQFESIMDELNKGKNDLNTEMAIINDKNIYISKLEENIKILVEENISLKTQSETITNSVSILQNEVEELRESQKEMEREKDRLCSVIQKIEESNLVHDNNVVHNTESNQLSANIKTINDEEIVKLSSAPLEQANEGYSQNTTSKIEYDAISDENRRLKSDIEGLQTYLKKISKENSVLNDKLRDSMASSECLPDKNEMVNSDLTNLKNEIKSRKDKIDHLERENSFLVEENLELKDQLESHNYSSEPKPKNVNEEDVISLRIKYKKLQESKESLEKKLTDLESLNTSVNGNIHEMQENNDKLKLSNEKLSRRLDEALVSLRHLHSLQENTELEYLRNILYEYLTGPGSHSITLAKVLAAVVKFDDIQTKQVLQKEKERQGLLRQLGLI